MVNVTPPPIQIARRYLSATQLGQVKVVFEAIWPGGQDNPGATDASAADYLDYLLGNDDALYYELRDWRVLYTAGLAMLNAVSLSRPGIAKPLENLSVGEATGILTDLATGKLQGFPDAAWQQRFFTVLRAHCIEGCLADPRWGGNQKAVVWDWLGYPRGQAQNFQRS